jgi:hypothetical protein
MAAQQRAAAGEAPPDVACDGPGAASTRPNAYLTAQSARAAGRGGLMAQRSGGVRQAGLAGERQGSSVLPLS